LNNLCFSLESLIYVSKSKLYISDKNKTADQEATKCAKEDKMT
jgi:hypothetical protein